VAVYPIADAFYTSLFDLQLTRPNRVPFVWFDNYVELMSDPSFWTAVSRTVVFTLVTVCGSVGLALGAALLLNETFRGRRLLSAMLLVPWATPSIVNGLMWKWIYDSDHGLLNGVLQRLGLIEDPIIWLADPDKAIFLLAQAAVWKQMPLAAILLLVTMKSIPDDLYRAAKVDGANVWQRFIHVTLPSLKPGFMLVFVYETMISIRHFDLFAIMTQGGPGDATFSLSWMIYSESFLNLRFGVGASLAFFLSIVTFALSYLFIRFLSQKH